VGAPNLNSSSSRDKSGESKMCNSEHNETD
jgi:hypothetical protein